MSDSTLSVKVLRTSAESRRAGPLQPRRLPMRGDERQAGDDRAVRGAALRCVLQAVAVKRLCVWASVIQDGRVVATDYAPDAGWFVPGKR